MRPFLSSLFLFLFLFLLLYSPSLALAMTRILIISHPLVYSPFFLSLYLPFPSLTSPPYTYEYRYKGYLDPYYSI